MSDRMKELAKILVKWNRREMGGDNATYEIWKLFEKEALEQWNGGTPPNSCKGD
jgi:hypothetical protein